MNEIVAEFIGTFLLILLGNGVVANVVLNDTKGHNSGWIVISIGWGLGVFVGVAVAGLFPWIKVLPFVVAQMLGAMSGAFIVWLFYRHHFNRTEDAAAQLGCFSTGPAIRKTGSNFLSELIGTFVLIFVILYIAEPSYPWSIREAVTGPMPGSLCWDLLQAHSSRPPYFCCMVY